MTIASCIGMVLRIMVLMADFTHILATRPDFTESDREWLHHLVADWQVIADLSFADLLLIVQDGDGNYRIVEQCRPSTVMTLRIDDAVGALVAPEMVGELDAAMQSKTVFRSTVLRAVGKSTVCNVYAPVRHDGKTLGLVVRETNMATRESNGRYESESINAGKQLYEMIPRGQFPYVNAIMSQRHVARVIGRNVAPLPSRAFDPSIAGLGAPIKSGGNGRSASRNGADGAISSGRFTGASDKSILSPCRPCDSSNT